MCRPVWKAGRLKSTCWRCLRLVMDMTVYLAACFLQSISTFGKGTSGKSGQGPLASHLHTGWRLVWKIDTLGDHSPTSWVPLHSAMFSSVALGHSMKTIPGKEHPFSFWAASVPWVYLQRWVGSSSSSSSYPPPPLLCLSSSTTSCTEGEWEKGS